MIKVKNYMRAFLIVSIFTASLLAVFIRTNDADGRIYDGLGRELSSPPVWATFFFTDEYLWAGLAWHIVDSIWFIGGITLIFRLAEGSK